jgi:hypothetical protein
VLAGKITALNRGQAFVSIEDIRALALPSLRHRLLLNFEGEADEVNTDTIIEEMLAASGRGTRQSGNGAERLGFPCMAPFTHCKSFSTNGPPIRKRFPEEAGIPARRLEAGVRGAEPRRSADAEARPGIEFADHRPYTVGDDFRHIDWKAYSGWAVCCFDCSTKNAICRSI